MSRPFSVQSPSCLEIAPYTSGEDAMGKKLKDATDDKEPFGRRLARLRKAAGYTQRSLAAEIGISQRVVAYYEIQTEHPPTHLLPRIADALRISTDQLLGRTPVTPRRAPKNERLMRQLRKVEKLPPKARHAVLEHIDALVAKYAAS